MICPHCGADTSQVYMCGHIPIARDVAMSDLRVLLGRVDVLLSIGAGDPERETPPEIDKALRQAAKAALILAEALGC